MKLPYVALSLSFMIISNGLLTNIVNRAALDIVNGYNLACLRVLHPSNISITLKQMYYNMARGLLRDSQKHSTFIALTSTTFDQYLATTKAHASGEESCYKPLQVFLASELTQHEFELICQQYKISTSKWLIFMSKSFTEESFFKPIALPFDSHVLTATEVEDGFVIREVYRINVSSPIKVINIGRWFTEAGLQISVKSMFARRSNLHGAVIRTGSIENWPISTFKRPLPDSPYLDGFFPRIWRELELILNFTSINYRSVDNTTGTKMGQGNWNGLIGMIIRGEIDVIVSELNINEERTEVLDFSAPLLLTKYQIYFPLSGYNLSWTAVLEPFDSLLWLAILLWIIVSAAALTICYKKSEPFTYPSDISIEPRASVFFVLQSLCQQGYSQVPDSWACRIIFLLAYLMSAIVIPSYSASLISSLTAQVPDRPFDTLEEMLAYGVYKLILAKNTAEYSHFARANNSLYAKVFEKLVLPIDHMLASFNTSALAVEKLCDGKGYFSFFGVESIIDLKVEKLLSPDCKITKFSQPLSTVYQGMGLAKSHPYTDLINYHIGRMVQTGITRRVRKSVWPLGTNKFDNDFKQVQAREVFQIFMCLLLGMIISVIILLLEIMHNRSKKSKKMYGKDFQKIFVNEFRL